MIDDWHRQVYARQIMLPEMGEAGQKKLFAASVLLVGAGGLGSPNALYLAAMGIGRIGVIDGDVVSASNLNRQILYTPDDIGHSKAEVAGQRMKMQNPDLSLDMYTQYLNEENAEEIISRYDIIVDCLDNFPARFILNDACIRLGKPFVHAGVYHLYGQTLTVIPGESPCLRCLFPQGGQETDPDPARKGIVGATAGVVGAMQATEVYKYLLGLPLNQRGFALYDGMQMQTQQLPLTPRPDCICCQRTSG